MSILGYIHEIVDYKHLRYVIIILNYDIPQIIIIICVSLSLSPHLSSCLIISNDIKPRFDVFYRQLRNRGFAERRVYG